MELQFKDTYDTVIVPLIQAPQFAESDSMFAHQDQCYINAFPIVVENTLSGDKEGYIVKRPGCTNTGVSVSSLITGSTDYWCDDNIAVTQLDDVYVCAIFDQTNSKFVICQYRVSAGTTVKIGEITGAGSSDKIHLTELTVAAVPTLGVVWTNATGTSSKGYYATSAAGVFTASSLTEIVDVDFPPKRGSPTQLVGGFVQMNGTTYIMTKAGEIAGSDLNSISSWNSLNSLQAISYPDQGVGLIRYKSHIVAFGENSIEFFVDVGNPSPVSPLQRMEEVFIKSGAITSRCFISIEDTLYWLGRSDTGQVGLYKLDGYNPVKLSSAFEDSCISKAAGGLGGGAGKLTSLSLFGQKHIFIAGTLYRPSYPLTATTDFATDVRGLNDADWYSTLVYNTSSGVFWGYAPRWAVGATGISTYPVGCSLFSSTNSSSATQVFLLGSGGNSLVSGTMGVVYQVSPGSPVWTDGQSAGTGTPFTVTIQPNQIRFGNERKKRIHKLKFIMDSLFTASETDSGSDLWLVYGKEDWSLNATAKTRKMTIPNTTYRYYFSNLGSCRSIGMAMVSRNKMPMKIYRFEIDGSQGV